MEEGSHDGLKEELVVGDRGLRSRTAHHAEDAGQKHVGRKIFLADLIGANTNGDVYRVA